MCVEPDRVANSIWVHFFYVKCCTYGVFKKDFFLYIFGRLYCVQERALTRTWESQPPPLPLPLTRLSALWLPFCRPMVILLHLFFTQYNKNSCSLQPGRSLMKLQKDNVWERPEIALGKLQARARSNSCWDCLKGSVLASLCCCNKPALIGWLISKNEFLTILEAQQSRVKVVCVCVCVCE